MKFNAFQLKIIALTLMFTEHVGRFWGELLPGKLPLYLRYAGRVVAPIFVFLVVESFFKTRDRGRYIFRLYVWAFIMQAGNIILSRLVQSTFHPANYYALDHNVMLSLATGVSTIAAFEWARSENGYRQWFGYILGVLFGIASLYTEASIFGLAIFLIFYFLHENKPWVYYAYTVLCLVVLAWNLHYFEHFWEFEFQWMMIAALPFLILYNGERGRFSLKYLFYTFYPLHLWGLYLMRFAMRLGR